MRVKTLKPFDRDLEQLPHSIRKKFLKQLQILIENPRYPSLHVKKVQGYEDIWEARVDFQYRFTFEYQGDLIVLRAIGNHDEVLGRP